MKKKDLLNFANSVAFLEAHHRKALVKNLRRSGKRGLFECKEVQDVLAKAGNNKRNDMHRRSCITAYQAKRVLVENKKGGHKFIHEFTNQEA